MEEMHLEKYEAEEIFLIIEFTSKCKKNNIFNTFLTYVTILPAALFSPFTSVPILNYSQMSYLENWTYAVRIRRV